MKNQTSKAYAEIISLLQKHKDLICFDIEDLNRKAALHLYGMNLKQTYGLNIDPKEIHNVGWQRFGEYMSIGQWGEKYGRKVSWSFDDSQPKDEVLLQISFPTGAYIFGDDYPTDLFKELFNELISYNPKYTDYVNSSLYFSLDNAAPVFNEFKNILLKYNDLNQKDRKRRKLEKMKADLDKLQQELS